MPNPLHSAWRSLWGEDPNFPEPRSAYLHIPFCHHRCAYCNFSVIANRNDLIPQFLDALECELQVLDSPRAMQTLYLGGGTPSLLPTPHLTRLLQLCQSWLPLEPQAEWTIEANPLDVDDNFCKLVTHHGIHRISLGGQSFSNRKLQILNRDHSRNDLLHAIAVASHWFDSVSLDLIFAAPGETLSEWRQDLDLALSLPIHHLSAYGLTYEKGARFWALHQQPNWPQVTEESELAMYQILIQQLHDAGWDHYEVSNFAKHGARSQHNQRYWSNHRWWAFGPGAARFVGRTRSLNHRSTSRYLQMIAQNECPTTEIESLDDDAIARDLFVFGLRRLEGLAWNQWSSLASPSLIQSFSDWIDQDLAAGWLERRGDQLRLTQSGLCISDSLWPKYLFPDPPTPSSHHHH